MHILLIIMLLACPMAEAQVTINRVTIGTGVRLTTPYTPEMYFDTEAVTGGCRIIDYNIAGGLNVEIPPTIGGLTVVEIYRYAFQDKGINSVTIPDTVTTFGYSCFDGNNLTSIDIPPHWAKIDGYAFANNQLAGSIDLTSDDTLSNDRYINSGAFMGDNMAITEVTLAVSGNPVYIGASAFGANPITKFVLGSSLNLITDTGMGLYSVGLKAAYTAGGAGTYNYSGGMWTKE